MKIGIFMTAVFLLSIAASAQTGGQFSITQSVIANGGADSGSGNFSVVGTNAQAIAGTNSTGGQFEVNGGFWQVFLAPTAANASVSGRVTTATGIGIANVRVSITNLGGASQTAITNGFGYFSFQEIPSGETYIVTVRSKQYQFSNGTRVLFVSDDVSDVIFIADFEEN